MQIEVVSGKCLLASPGLKKTLASLTLYESRRFDVGMTSFLSTLDYHTDSKYVLIARTKHGIVGWLSVAEYKKDNSATLNFFTLPECRRRGVGTQLLHALRALTSLRLEINPHDHTSYGFFKANGLHGTYDDVIGSMSVLVA